MGTVTSGSAPLRAVAVAYLACQIVQAGILVVFLVASLLFAGAQVTRSASPAWEALVPFPVFPVPAWMPAIPAAAGLALAVIWAVTARAADAGALTGAIGPTVAAAVTPGFLVLAYEGAPPEPYLLPLAVTGASLIVVVTASVIAGARIRGESTNVERSRS
ncbi:hypothetical protein GCM10027411_18450 [Microbacterium aureliae]